MDAPAEDAWEADRDGTNVDVGVNVQMAPPAAAFFGVQHRETGTQGQWIDDGNLIVGQPATIENVGPSQDVQTRYLDINMNASDWSATHVCPSE